MQNESGRSLVEMLGTLAIMGILSMIGIAAFHSAMNKHKVNTLIQEAQKRAVIASAQIILHDQKPSLAEFDSSNATEMGRFGAVTQEGLTNQFGIQISYMDRPICQALLNAIGDKTPIRRLSYPNTPTVPLTECDEVGKYLIIYNDDLSHKDKAVATTEPEPEPAQECETDSDCKTVCGKCGADQMCQECEVEATSCTTNQQCTGVCAGCNTETNTCQYMCEPVEYLESAGTQYIDTGIECTNNLVVSFKGSCSTNENAACCGGIDVANAPTYFRHHWSPFENGFAYWIMYSPGNAYPNRPPYFEVNTVYEAKVDPVNGVLTVNGVDYSFPPITSSFTTGKSYGIFGRYSNSGAIQSRPSRFYYFKMWNNDTLVRDFIPVLAPKKEGTGQEPAMFDKVNNEIYYNAGTGTFKYGL